MFSFFTFLSLHTDDGDDDDDDADGVFGGKFIARDHGQGDLPFFFGLATCTCYLKVSLFFYTKVFMMNEMRFS